MALAIIAAPLLSAWALSTDPFGRLLYASPALPGAVHDLSAAREHGIVDALTAADIKCWALRDGAASTTGCPTCASSGRSAGAGRGPWRGRDGRIL
jgi:hypothetical protein